MFDIFKEDIKVVFERDPADAKKRRVWA